MIAYADLGPMSTVHLFLRIPVPLAAGGWAWGELPRYGGVLAREFAYSAHECRSLVQTYGRSITRIATRIELGDRFTVGARGPVTGLWVGLREWQWSVDLRDFRPVGEYMCGWRPAVRAYWEQTGELFERKRFDAHAVGLSLVPSPRAVPVAEAA